MMNCNFIFSVITFFYLSQVPVQTLKVFKRSPDPTYVTLGDTLELNVTYEDAGSDKVGVVWRNNNSELIYEKFRNVGPDDNPDSRASRKGQATLVLKNTKFSDSGTYNVHVSTATDSETRTFSVIIQVASKAERSCSGIGDNFSCQCKGIGGTPPAITSWLKDSKTISNDATLTKDEIETGNEGIYSCKALSGNLVDFSNITLNKPTSISFTSNPRNATIDGTVTITCKASVYPPPEYVITFNGSKIIDGVVNGVKLISEVSRKDAGKYECMARNVLGNMTASFYLNVKEKPPATTQPSTNATSTKVKPSTTAEPSKNTTSTKVPTGEKGKTIELGIILGIVIGGVLFIVLLIVLVCCCCCAETAIFAYFLSKWRCCEYFRCDCCIHISDRDSEEPVVHPHSGSNVGSLPRDDNAYETVDKAKVHKAAEAGPSNGSNPPDGNDSGLPPVYAVVDKKKTKKATQPPAVTYAALDAVALQPDSSKMRNRDREETNYASINLENLQSDLV